MRALFRRRGARPPLRGAAIAVLAVAMGAVMLRVGGDQPLDGMARLEAGPAASALLVPTSAKPGTSGDPDPGQPRAAGDPAAADPSAATATAAATTGAGAVVVAGGSDARPVAAVAGATPTASITPAASVGAGAGAPAAGAPAPNPDAATGTTSTTGPPASAATTTAPSAQVTTTVGARAGMARNPDVEAQVVPLTNADRRAGGLSQLARNGCLDAAASQYAEQLARSGVLAHNPASGANVTACRPYAAWGDNIGTAAPCSASLLEEKWMASATHRHNILTPAFQYIGVGAWDDGAGGCWVQVLFSS